MAVVKKTLVKPGRYVTPDGPIHITPERIRSWVSDHALLKSEGIQFPVPFGHQTAARPRSADDSAYLRSKYNAGYVRELMEGPDGSLEGVLDLPALKVDADGHVIDPQTGTAIKEVSLGIGPWKDGQGQMWPDIINHVALVPLPVWAGQDGFTGLSTVLPKLTYLSTRMATDDKKEKSKADNDFDAISADREANPDSPDEVDTDGDGDTDAVLTPTGVPQANAEEAQFLQVKQLLAEMGVALPDSTDMAHGWEHIVVALHAIKTRLQAEAAQEQGAKQQQMNPGTSANTQAAPQMPSMVMSTQPTTALEKALFTKLATAKKESRLALLAGLEVRGLPKDVADELRAEIGKTRMSLSPVGDVANDEIDGKLNILGRVKMLDLTTRLATGSTAANTDDESDRPVKRFGNVEVNKAQLEIIEQNVRETFGRNGKK